MYGLKMLALQGQEKDRSGRLTGAVMSTLGRRIVANDNNERRLAALPVANVWRYATAEDADVGRSARATQCNKDGICWGLLPRQTPVKGVDVISGRCAGRWRR